MVNLSRKNIARVSNLKMNKTSKTRHLKLIAAFVISIFAANGIFTLSTHSICDVESFSFCSHQYEKTVINPTCIHDGLVVMTCIKCGNTYIAQSIPALGHDMSYVLEFNDSTCTEKGSKTIACSRCEYTETLNIPPKQHELSDWITDTEPSCKSNGFRHIVCLVCGKVISQESIAPLGHNYDVFYKPPTCTQPGVNFFSCKRCGDTYSQTVCNALGHEIDKWQAVKPATCTTSGISEGKCMRCGKTETKTINATGHKKSNWIIDKPADCESTGYRHISCTVCKDTLETETIAAKGHSIIVDKAVAATCTANGKTEGIRCKVCKKTLKQQTIIKATGHKTKNIKIAATIGKDGKYATVCKVCNKTVKSTPIPKISSVKLSALSYTYNNKTKTPDVIIKDSKGKVLKRSTDYTLKYSSERKNVGSYYVTVSFKGNYSGTKKLKFQILPSVVSALSATQTSSTVKLTWSKASGANGYRVYKYDSKSKKWIRLAETSKTSYTIKGLSSATTYKFAVRPFTKTNSETLFASKYISITTSTKPKTPTLKAASGSKKATLSWNKISGATGYAIYMATSKNGSYKQIATVKNNTTKFAKTGLAKGKRYYFKVKAYKTVGNFKIYSTSSSAVCVTVR